LSSLATAPCSTEVSQSVIDPVVDAVAYEAASGLTASPKTLSPWLFYDEAGSELFEQITQLPEYYLTRTERAIFAAHADEIIETAAGKRCLTMVELGAGTATKTGILLQAAVRRQSQVMYQPIDVSESCLNEARANLELKIAGVKVVPQLANYITQPITLTRPPHARILALYIGSSIGNFSPEQAREILSNLRAQLEPGDALLLGTDLAPGKHKDAATLLAAYDDASGVTAAFNLNVLTRINRDLGADFEVGQFVHRAVWNESASRIEMHLESTVDQRVFIPESVGYSALDLAFVEGETIHTENSYKFTRESIETLKSDCGFAITKTFEDANGLFAVTLASAV
jgi:L-histidine N-alpha-methyltransferase